MNLLAGVAFPLSIGTAEAMRKRQDSKVRMKASHLGYIVRVVVKDWMGAECNLERIGTPKDQILYRSIISPCGNFFFGQIARQFGGSYIV